MAAGKYRTIVADPPWPYDEGFNGFGTRRRLPYASMSLEDISALPIRDFASNGAHLYLWATSRYLPEALGLVEMWGFSYAVTLVWAKRAGQKGLGGRWAVTTEFIVHAAAPAYAPPRKVQRAGALIRKAREEKGLTRAEVFHRVRGGKKTGLVNNWELDISLPNEGDWCKLQKLLPALADVPRPEVSPPAPRKSAPYSQKPEAFLDLVEQVSPSPYLELFARRQRLGWDTWGDEALSHVELTA